MNYRLLSKVEAQNSFPWLFSSHCSLLFVMSLLLFSWLFSCVNAWGGNLFVDVAHICGWWLWCYSHCCSSPLLWYMSPSSFSSSYGVGHGHHGLIVVVVSSCPPSNSWSYYLVVLIVMVVVIFSLLQVVIAYHHFPNFNDLVVLVIMMIFLLL